jgi:hypothetical protein
MESSWRGRRSTSSCRRQMPEEEAGVSPGTATTGRRGVGSGGGETYWGVGSGGRRRLRETYGNHV